MTFSAERQVRLLFLVGFASSQCWVDIERGFSGFPWAEPGSFGPLVQPPFELPRPWRMDFGQMPCRPGIRIPFGSSASLIVSQKCL